MGAMPSCPRPHLVVLPGELLALFVIEVDQAATVLAVRAGRFLEGLKAACDVLGFVGLQREDERLEELLPWVGNV